MSTRLITTLFLLLAVVSSCKDEEQNMLEMVHEAVVRATNWSKLLVSLSDENEMGNNNGIISNGYSALSDCVEEYEDSEDRLQRLLISPQTYRFSNKLSWLNGVLTSHRTCLDELHERGYFVPQEANNLTTLLHRALGLFARLRTVHKEDKFPLIMDSDEKRGFLVSWNASTSKADYVVAKDGTGNYTTINEVVKALDKRKLNEHERVVVYVKLGNYTENVKINKDMKNVMFVGDGIDKTVVSGNWHKTHEISTRNSATFRKDNSLNLLLLFCFSILQFF
ncbi:Pectinesterase/pectinesterase inhibitor [Thalictrum thalictroides]|uniref:Pectinesterase/pectinesterase inhibitor n=1 Tax=Thalictrum thalictroides TaxID=46969 RepID=A0A7J6VTN6_THATH|nr:Pectinesterase/pectinesterase inhibitor [Thalictrum thalictroides]